MKMHERFGLGVALFLVIGFCTALGGVIGNGFGFLDLNSDPFIRIVYMGLSVGGISVITGMFLGIALGYVAEFLVWITEGIHMKIKKFKNRKRLKRERALLDANAERMRQVRFESDYQ